MPSNFSLEATGAALFTFSGFEKFAAPKLRHGAASSACASVPRSPMTTLCISVLLVCLPFAVGGQGLPYSEAKAMQDAAESISRVRGFKSDLTMVHTRAEDKRPFKLLLQSRGESVEIKVQYDGTFHLPQVPQEDWHSSRLVHTLEPGALSIQLFLGFGGQLEPGGAGEINLSEFASKCAQKCQHLSEVLNKLKTAMQLGDVSIAAIGISVPKETPTGRKVYLKRGPRVVASVDSAETGPAVWMFEDYPPKEHTISYAAKEGQPPLTCYLVFKTLAPGDPLPLNSFYVWKGEPSGPADRSQPSSTATNRASGAAGSGR
jgi:hypothetical protein